MNWRRILAISMLWLLASTVATAQEKPAKDQSDRISVETVADDQAFEDLHQQYLEKDALQLERPEGEEEPEDDREPMRLPRWLISFLSFLGPVFRVLFYIGIAGVVGYIIFFIVMSVWGTNIRAMFPRKKTRVDEDDVLVPSFKPDEATAKSLLGDADSLAAEGKYAEAVHLLLYRSIEDIQTKRGQRLSTALTSREIGQLDDLPAGPREALDPIISIVERSFFGGREVTEKDWLSARASYEAFAFGEAWR